MERKSKLSLLCMAVPFIGTVGLTSCQQVKKETKLNVLFVAVDDMNDWVGFLNGYPGVKTPNLDRLAERGVSFTNAHCPSPLCGPSRASVMSGLYPHKTGIYNNGQWWRPNYPEMVTIPMHFKANGYEVVGAGKIFHHTAGFNPPDQWNVFVPLTYDDPWDRESRVNYPQVKVEERPDWVPLSGLNIAHEFDWGALPGKPEEDYNDYKTVEWCINYLENKQDDQPFFLACGLFHPHIPWYVPQKYFDLYPLDQIVLPTIYQDDLNDIPPVGQEIAAVRRSHLKMIKKAEKWKNAIQAYLASISFADAQIGRLLDKLDQSGKADNTIIVFWSDHGWHLGEKEHMHKMTLWERATRVPFIVVDPRTGIKGSCNTPVNLVDIHKTLNELCGLPQLPQLDGESLVPQLHDLNAKRENPSLICYQKGNFALQDERYHYIQYHDGTEELYDHQTDRHEWYNIANDKNNDLLNKYRKFIPQQIKDDVPKKGAFEFDYKNYTWKRKKK
ncbi:DUF229 domain-containing protein [Puteibacter caeruleilacunae]|nr:DUF229 domain-containing protein [Puteibacter caeruleilacunae]